jgi:hypothetical protein
MAFYGVRGWVVRPANSTGPAEDYEGLPAATITALRRFGTFLSREEGIKPSVRPVSLFGQTHDTTPATSRLVSWILILSASTQEALLSKYTVTQLQAIISRRLSRSLSLLALPRVIQGLLSGKS